MYYMRTFPASYQFIWFPKILIIICHSRWVPVTQVYFQKVFWCSYFECIPYFLLWELYLSCSPRTCLLAFFFLLFLFFFLFFLLSFSNFVPLFLWIDLFYSISVTSANSVFFFYFFCQFLGCNSGLIVFFLCFMS